MIHEHCFLEIIRKPINFGRGAAEFWSQPKKCPKFKFSVSSPYNITVAEKNPIVQDERRDRRKTTRWRKDKSPPQAHLILDVTIVSTILT